MRPFLKLTLLAALSAGLLMARSHALAQGSDRRVPEGVTAHRDLPYVTNGYPRQKLDLYLPPSEAPLPVIIWIHGGAWMGGDKAAPPVMPYTREGFAVASLAYRFSQHAPFPAQIEDCKAAVRWLRSHARRYHLDPQRFGVIGASAGGHLAALLGTSGAVKDLEGTLGSPDESSGVQCVVDLFGPTDLTRMGGSHDGPDSPEARLLGGPVQEDKARADRANPIRYVDRGDPPFLILHGDRDPVVPFNQSELLRDALKQAGVEVELIPVAGAGHGGPGFQTGENGARITAFFRKHLKPAP